MGKISDLPNIFIEFTFYCENELQYLYDAVVVVVVVVVVVSSSSSRGERDKIGSS
jgi:hypothetical protein